MTDRQRRNALKSLGGLLLAPLLPGCAAAPQRPQQIAAGDYDALARFMRDSIAHEMAAHDVVGLSIAIVDDQRIVWSHGAGWANHERGLPAAADTVYRMGSISKLFTVTAALQLAQQGRFALDAPIQQALPEFAIRSRFGEARITPRQLMTHHGGLPRDVLKGMWGRQTEDFRAMIGRLREHDLAYPPGQLMVYSNVGMTVLGGAVENVAHAPFAEHLQRTLLQPLGMADASFSTAEMPAAKQACAYEKKRPVDEPALRDIPAGGLSASVIDLGKFLMMVFAGGRAGERSILQPDMLEEMLRPQNPGNELDGSLQTGLGWMLGNSTGILGMDAGPLAHHSGATIHHRSLLYALPRHKLGVIVAANSGSADKITGKIARQALELALEAKTGLRRRDGETLPPVETPLSAAALADYPGAYTTQAGLARIVRDGERLKVQALGKTFNLVAGTDGYLYLRYSLLGLIPVPLGELGQVGIRRQHLGGRDVLVARVNGSKVLLGERMVGTPPRPEFVGIYEPLFEAGEYRLLERIEVFEEDGQLLVRVQTAMADEDLPPTVLRIVSEREALLLGPLADAGEVVRLQEAGGETRVVFSGITFQRVKPREHDTAA